MASESATEIQLLDLQANWAKVKAGLKGGDRYSGAPKRPTFRFQKAPEMSKDPNPVLGDVFTGKGFSGRQK